MYQEIKCRTWIFQRYRVLHSDDCQMAVQNQKKKKSNGHLKNGGCARACTYCLCNAWDELYLPRTAHKQKVQCQIHQIWQSSKYSSSLVSSKSATRRNQRQQGSVRRSAFGFNVPNAEERGEGRELGASSSRACSTLLNQEMS